VAVRIFAGLGAGLWLVAMSSGVSAAIWNWGCRGQLGDQQVIFNSGTLLILADKTPLGDIRKLDTGALSATIDAEKDSSKTLAIYRAETDEGGLVKKLEFSRDNGKYNLVLTEKSSRIIYKKHLYLGGRDEDTAIFRKVYRMKREGEPAREITMQCKEYQLSTCGGRCKSD
jgi:hypothetical protein